MGALISIRGTLIEVGTLDSGLGGIALQVDGELVTLDGLKKEECKLMAKHLESIVEIKILDPNG